jgi:beta-barrel assembly-enhancing protease
MSLMKKILICFVFFLMLFRAFSNVEAQDEVRMGCFQDRSLTVQSVLVLNPTLEKRIQQVGEKVAQASGKPEIKFSYRILNDPTINAYAAPGGRIYILTGLLDFLTSEDELAAVLGHEMAHVIQSHTVKSIKSDYWTRAIGGAFINAAGAAVGVQIGGSKGQLAQMGTNLALSAAGSPLFNAMSKGYSRGNELEADEMGQELLEKAGYNPEAMTTYLQRLETIKYTLESSKKDYPSALINAEPGLGERIQNLRAKRGN